MGVQMKLAAISIVLGTSLIWLQVAVATAQDAEVCDTLYEEAKSINQCFAFQAYVQTCPTHKFKLFADAFIASQCGPEAGDNTDQANSGEGAESTEIEVSLGAEDAVGPIADRCDILAGNPYHPFFSEADSSLKNALPMFAGRIEGEAVAACEAALVEFPNSPRMLGQAARALQKNKDYAEALDYAQRGTDLNDPLAIYVLASLNRFGLGVSQDTDAAISLYQDSSSLGFIPSDNELGMIFRNSELPQFDAARAKALFQKAIEAGYPPAMHMVGADQLYDVGIYEKSILSAVRNFRDASELGYTQSSIQLGNMYFDGTDLTQDYAEALRWYLKATERPDEAAYAFQTIAFMYENGLGVDEDATAALDYHKSASENGSDYSSFKLAEALIDGELVEQDLDTARVLLESAADNGLVEAQHMLAVALETGIFGDVDLFEAAALYETASKSGYGPSSYKLGKFHLYGTVVKKDVSEAIRLLELAVEDSDDQVKIDVANLYIDEDQSKIKNGLSAAAAMITPLVDKDVDAALVPYAKLVMLGELKSDDAETLFGILEKALAAGDNSVSFPIAMGLMNGRGVERDSEKALAFLEDRAKQGDKKAAVTLGRMYFTGENFERDISKAKEYFEPLVESDDLLSLEVMAAISFAEGNEELATELSDRAVKAGSDLAPFNLGRGENIDLSIFNLTKRDVARQIQTRLNEANCNAGEPDGAWGNNSRAALAYFFEQPSLIYREVTEPSLVLMWALNSNHLGSCPLRCAATEDLIDGACVRKTCAAGLRLANDGSCFKPVPRGAQQSGCFKFNGQTFCD